MVKTLLITGGSRGIGAATALAAARDGWQVVVNYRSAKAGADTVVEAIREAGGEAWSVAGDISREEDVLAIFAAIRARHGSLEGLVNNAGILPRIGRFEDISLARWQETLAINTTGAFLCCREAVRLMAPRHGGKGGTIVNVSSMAATLGGAGEFLDYGASKGAVETLTIGLSKELGPDQIRVNAVRPGLIATEIHESAGDASRAERLKSNVPLGRIGSAEETASVITWLLSDAASYVTGTSVAVSGGR
ncbi:SDR family oxidoreductase [Pseudogemmobacter faecipullorum]|uniref:SDR family oxidoreductase n=1 Tax=Pseudogemmobacter faecipullorum TaxID=2755041 RepID=A0ABS8CPJ9_9RHOB|nr:SDR family oxidoreductase [Pseudogemmobacter faecipullorum]MCB5411299.1 SDR family oxidoreductase [Pseudogemmobacter faecipullorum]